MRVSVSDVSRIRRLLDGTGPFNAVAALAVLVGVLALLLQLQSPDAALWTGQPVRAVNDGGLAYYTFRGQQYTIDVSGAVPAHPEPLTVYVDPSNPAAGVLDTLTNRLVDALIVGGPFLIAILAFCLGLLRRVRRRRRRPPVGRDTFGQGLDIATMSWLREQQQR
jgi:hypothetical protein